MVNMVRANIDVPDSLWREFTQKVVEKFGKVRDERNKAIAEALKLWLDQS